MIYFTSDLHLGHEAIIYMQNRPFASLEEMNRTLIDNFNSIIKDKDTVYILGDLFHKVEVDKANEIIKKLNGQKYLIRGNHDKDYDPSLFIEISDFKNVKFDGLPQITLMHYPMLEWPKSRRGSIQLHGHIHSTNDEYNLKNKLEGIRRYDVGVDANNYRPVSIKEIIRFLGI